MNPSSEARHQIAAEAADWLLHFQEAPAPDAHEQFAEWLTRSPTHIEEYLAVSTAWAGMKLPHEGEFTTHALVAAARDPDADRVLRPEQFNRPRRQEPGMGSRGRSRRMPWIAIAATIVAGVGVWIFLGRMQPESDFRTAIGEQRSVSLSDGSLIFLNTDTEVRTDWTPTERRITLERGEARFQVAKDQRRPFTVTTRDATIRALGTVFNVRAKSGATEITVVEGRVSVAGESAGSPLNAPRLELAAGDRASVDVGGQIRPNIGPPIERVSAWIERRLVFRGDPLSSVVAEFNRYRVKPLVIDDRELAKLQISGVFDSSDPDSLLAYLSSFEAVAIERPGDGTLHLARTPGSSTQNN